MIYANLCKPVFIYKQRKILSIQSKNIDFEALRTDSLNSEEKKKGLIVKNVVYRRI